MKPDSMDSKLTVGERGLAYLVQHPGERFSVATVAKAIGCSRGGLRGCKSFMTAWRKNHTPLAVGERGLAFLAQHPGERFRVADVAKAIGVNQSVLYGETLFMAELKARSETITLTDLSKSAGPIPVAEVAERYIQNPTRGRPMDVDSDTRLRRLATEFSDWLGTPATTGHFTEETVTRFLNNRCQDLAPSTAERVQRSVFMLWSYAAELGVCPPPSRSRSRRSSAARPVSAQSEKAKPPHERAATNPQLDRIEEMLAELRRGGGSRAGQAGAMPADQPLTPSSSLSDVLSRYVDERGLADKTRDFYRKALRSFELFLNRPAQLSDLSDDSIADFVAWRRRTSKPETCDKVRVALTSWWRYAGQLRLIESPAAPMGFDQELAGCLAAIAARNAEATKDDPSMSLDAALEMYFRERLTFGSDSTKRQLRINARRLGDFLGRPPRTTDLTDEVVRESMAKMSTAGLDPRTVNKFRDNMLAVWRFLHQRRIVPTLPDVKPMPEPQRDPIAWSKEELAKLWAACDAQRGMIGEAPARLWWHALHAVAWNTGERISALMDVERNDVDLDRGWILVRAEHRKGKRADQTSKLHPDTCALLRELFVFGSDKRVFSWPYTRVYLWVRYGKLLEKAGLPNDRRHKFHCIRKSAASWFEHAGGNAQQLLGHADARVTQKYLDPRIVRTTHAADVLFQPGKSAP